MILHIMIVYLEELFEDLSALVNAEADCGPRLEVTYHGRPNSSTLHIDMHLLCIVFAARAECPHLPR